MINLSRDLASSEEEVRKILKQRYLYAGSRFPLVYPELLNSFNIDINEQEFPADKIRKIKSTVAKQKKTLIEKYADTKKEPIHLVVSKDNLFDWMVGRTDPKKPLMEHQKYATIEFMKSKRGMLLCHPTGSGKTITAIAISECFLRNSPSDTKTIIVTPLSVREQFKAELETFMSSGFDTESRYLFYSEGEFSKVPLETCERSLIIIDEAQKRRTTVRVSDPTHTQLASEFIKRCDVASRVLLLSATPFWNGRNDILNLVRMIVGRNVTSGDLENSKIMGGLFSYILPSTFAGNVFPDVIHHMKKPLLMDEDFYKKYFAAQEKGVIEFETKEGHMLNFSSLDSLDEEELTGGKKYGVFYSNIRQACDIEGSPKYKFILDTIKESGEGSQIVIHSCFLEPLRILSNAFDELGIDYGKVTGEEKEDDRRTAVVNYNNKQTRILLLSDAGREGISLNNTNIMFIVDPLFSPAATKQTIGRVVRTNSHKLPATVHIFYLWIKKQITNEIDRIPLTGDEYVRIIADRKLKALTELTTRYIKNNSVEYLNSGR
jgi:superfamily II DNA or RNA helicase